MIVLWQTDAPMQPDPWENDRHGLKLYSIIQSKF